MGVLKYEDRDRNLQIQRSGRECAESLTIPASVAMADFISNSAILPLIRPSATHAGGAQPWLRA